MTRHTLTMREDQRAALAKTLLRDADEYAALLFCGRSRTVDPWTGLPQERYLVRELVEVDPSAFHSRSPEGLTWSTTPFFNCLKRAEIEDLAVAVAHSHPSGPLAFSAQDDVAEKELFRIAFDRLNSERPHLSIVMNGKEDLVARAYGPDLSPVPVDLIRSFGDRWRFWPASAPAAARHLDRQQRAFGRDSTADLQSLRVGVVGCGGTGSAVVALLARIGVAHIALFDFDRIEETNLNRVHFSTRADAIVRRRKIEVIAEALGEMGLQSSVVSIPYDVTDARARDALLSCDIVLGCTDDHSGRNILNRIAHFYLIPVIDLGLLIEPSKDASGYDVFDGRVTVIQPGAPCQVCRGLISTDKLFAESLMRTNPQLYEQRRRAGYVPSLNEQNPAVVTFTTEVATMAVNELFQRLTGFRGENGHAYERVRRFDELKDTDTIPAGRSRPGCKLCDRRIYDGRGDCTPFLDIAP
ncbi:ThiF family protein [Hyphomicrobium denitrificans 1NES1]|uniref:ThiF family protein n=1 Tax=Hyphomicrobium denitrificans 1NES1 TaxID=670307 RepID=N0B4B8_9HYPH|nr:ThiF family adenylyltransferase [Hyphomicrobium denitrificans]AGK57042.1 ThiF family protein [Hyphomicrobium denitrificans 1NES1]